MHCAEPSSLALLPPHGIGRNKQRKLFSMQRTMAARQSGKDRRDKLAHGDAEITDERYDNDRGAVGSSHVVPFR